MKETTLAEVEDAIGRDVEPWAVAQTYGRMKYLAAMDAKGGINHRDLDSRSFFGWASRQMPEVYERMKGSFPWGPEPPDWDEKWPPTDGEAGHKYLYGDEDPDWRRVGDQRRR